MSLTTSQIFSHLDLKCESSTVSYPLAEKVLEMNAALDEVTGHILRASGKWQYDDSNHEDYPFITSNVSAAQDDYTFTSDEQGNIILDVYKVMLMDPDTELFYELTPVDQQNDLEMQQFYSGQTFTGRVQKYDKTGNGIILEGPPGFTMDDAIKIFINRESSHFTVSDTTKRPGIDGRYHAYIVLHASASFCSRKEKFALADRYQASVEKWEKNIEIGYRDRGREESSFITSETVNSV